MTAAEITENGRLAVECLATANDRIARARRAYYDTPEHESSRLYTIDLAVNAHKEAEKAIGVALVLIGEIIGP